MSIHQHIHVISGGLSIGKTFPKTILALNGITDTVIVSNPLEEYKKEDQDKIKAEFAAVKKLAEDVGITYLDPIIYTNNTFQDVIDAVIALYEKHPDAEFSFNITGGSKIQALALYRASDFMDANAYYVIKETGEVSLLTKCRLPAKDIGKNPNIPILLEIMGKESGNIARTDLKRKMEKAYKPIRNRDREEHILKEGTFSVMLGQLLDWNLIEEGYENKRNKYYKIKSEGRIMLRMYNISNPK